MYKDLMGNTFKTHSGIRKAYPDVNWPNVITDTLLAMHNITPVPRELTDPEKVTATKTRIRQEASDAIEATAWRMERALERERLDIEGESSVDVQREREAIRIASNRIEVLIDSVESVDELDTITLDVIDEDYPSEKRLISQYKFRARFTLPEKVAIEEASKTNSTLSVIAADMNAAIELDLDNPELLTGLQYIESLGLLAEGRAEEVLA